MTAKQAHSSPVDEYGPKLLSSFRVDSMSVRIYTKSFSNFNENWKVDRGYAV